MGLLQWIKSRFAPRPIVRDVSRMTSDVVGDDAATRQEEVDTTVQPLKPGNLRLGVRDPRLLPKPKPNALLRWRKKPKIMAREEADRLFSETLRTNDRNVRDLTTDVEQLRRYGLARVDERR